MSVLRKSRLTSHVSHAKHPLSGPWLRELRRARQVVDEYVQALEIAFVNRDVSTGCPDLCSERLRCVAYETLNTIPKLPRNSLSRVRLWNVLYGMITFVFQQMVKHGKFPCALDIRGLLASVLALDVFERGCEQLANAREYPTVLFWHSTQDHKFAASQARSWVTSRLTCPCHSFAFSACMEHLLPGLAQLSLSVVGSCPGASTLLTSVLLLSPARREPSHGTAMDSLRYMGSTLRALVPLLAASALASRMHQAQQMCQHVSVARSHGDGVDGGGTGGGDGGSHNGDGGGGGDIHGGDGGDDGGGGGGGGVVVMHGLPAVKPRAVLSTGALASIALDYHVGLPFALATNDTSDTTALASRDMFIAGTRRSDDLPVMSRVFADGHSAWRQCQVREMLRGVSGVVRELDWLACQAHSVLVLPLLPYCDWQRVRRSPRRTCRIITRMLSVVARVHARGVTHGSLSPDVWLGGCVGLPLVLGGAFRAARGINEKVLCASAHPFVMHHTSSGDVSSATMRAFEQDVEALGLIIGWLLCVPKFGTSVLVPQAAHMLLEQYAASLVEIEAWKHPYLRLIGELLRGERVEDALKAVTPWTAVFSEDKKQAFTDCMSSCRTTNISALVESHDDGGSSIISGFVKSAGAVAGKLPPTPSILGGKKGNSGRPCVLSKEKRSPETFGGVSASKRVASASRDGKLNMHRLTCSPSEVCVGALREHRGAVTDVYRLDCCGRMNKMGLPCSPRDNVLELLHRVPRGVKPAQPRSARSRRLVSSQSAPPLLASHRHNSMSRGYRTIRWPQSLKCKSDAWSMRNDLKYGRFKGLGRRRKQVRPRRRAQSKSPGRDVWRSQFFSRGSR